MSSFSLASYNIHAGTDGWGRPHDVIASCRKLDADILVLPESWRPEEGPSIARAVADSLGYDVAEEDLGAGRLLGPAPDADSRWGPRPGHRAIASLRLDDRVPRVTSPDPRRSLSRGHWGVAVLSRLPVRRTEVIDLGQLARDPARRAAIVREVLLDGRVVTVIGTHMSHLMHASVVQYGRLRRELARRGLPAPETPAVLAGDMNLWGPPLGVLLPGWHRPIRGRTWPARRPLAQLDHVLVSRGLRSSEPAIFAPGDGFGSDHRPVRVVLGLGS